MMERWKFWRAVHPFKYDQETGRGLAFVSYSIWTDEVRVRHSLLGYVCGFSVMSRLAYLKALTGC